MKYKLPNNQTEILPNLLGLNSIEEVGLSEFEGFLKAEIILTEKLTARTRFNAKYILNIHKIALEHLYSFAGKLRDVNMSKNGFPFPAAKYLSQSMSLFEEEILSRLPNKYANKEDLIADIATVHGELLFIHPFREGNGRASRILANIMARKQGYEALLFEKINIDNFDQYVKAIQEAANKNYDPMKGIIRLIFPD